jgi:CII-binding regulator of phage lambda lysogenization HflD
MDEGTEGTKKMSIEQLIAAIKAMPATDQNKIAEEIGDENKKVTEGLRNSIKMSEEQLEVSIKHKKVLAETAAILNDTFEEAKQRVKIAEDQLILMEKQKIEGMNEEDAKNFSKGLREAKEEIRKFGTMNKEAFGENADIYEEMLQNFKEQVDLEEGLNAIRGDGVVLADKLAGSLGIQKKYKDSILGTTVSLLSKLNEEGIEGDRARKAMKKYLSDLFTAKNIALNIFNAIKKNSIELFTNFDKAQASLAAATGQGDKFRGTLYEVGREGNLFGVSMDDAGKAIGTLVDQTSNFTSLSKATQSSLALNVAKMEKLGVATSDSAAIFQNFNQALGMTAKESMNMQTELAMAGVSIGVNAGKMTKDFNASLSTLMVYGRESVDVFKGIAAAAKAAGVETSTLLGIASKFDTFAGAAEGAGKLNALLGTQLSTTEMLMATEDERIRMLVESVQSQGVAFQDMDRFTQKAIANSVGITDMAEANRIFGMSLEAYDENERKLNASADAQKKLDDAVAKTVPVMDQFKKLGAEIVVALEPMLKTLESGAKILTDWFKDKSTEEKEQLAFWVSLGATFILVMPILKGMIGMIKLMIPTLGAADKVASKSGKGFAKFGKGVGKALANVGKGLIQFGAGLITTMAPVIAFVGAAALLAAAIAGIGYAFASVVDKAKEFYEIIYGSADTQSQVKEFEARAAEAMATIVSSNHEGALSSIKAMVEEVNKMGQDVKVSSTIENLALITAGKASSITGERVTASQTNVTANVQNFFEGMEMTLNVDGANFKAYVAKVANGEST